MNNKPIYVEIPIKSSVNEIWEKSQNPTLHQQWDLRFSSILYLPKKSEDEPQSFRYETKIGFGLKVSGWGKSIGSLNKEDGSNISSLHFGSPQKISLISEGKGYWKYIPADRGTTFLTQYDYDVRYGLLGRLADYFFRPLIGWATALSFDVLKRWVEKGEIPRTQYTRFFSTLLITIFFSFIWLYQGLIPKIIARHPEEVSMLSSLSSIEGSTAVTAVGIIGALECLFGFAWLFYRNKRHLHLMQIIVFPVLTLCSVLAAPASFMHPFNPITFNACLWILSILGFILAKDVPTATNCKRSRKEGSK